ASEATLVFDLSALASARILKAELSWHPPWSRAGEIVVTSGDQPVARMKMADASPVPFFDVTSWLQNTARSSTDARLLVKRIDGDSRGVLGPIEGPHAPHLRVWIEAEPQAGKLVQT